MSVLPQELMRKISAKSHESSEQTSANDLPDQRFGDLMKVASVDDRPKDKDLFSLIEEEDDDEVNEPLCSAPYPTFLQTSCPSDQEPETAAVLMATSPLVAQPVPFDPGFSNVATAPRVSISPGIEALFEKMASSMILMCSSNETETTLYLDNPHFASSVFFGSKITIREFSTAPKAFNIEIASSPAAIAALEAGKQDLLAAFQQGNFNFSVHRIDSHIQEERPVFHRKESRDHDHRERKGGREQ
jgi:hypothetical protein